MAEAPILTVMHDIHVPSDPGWWPLAPGWWLLTALLVFLVVIGIHLWTSLQSLQKEALKELNRIDREFKNNQRADKFCMELSILLRRVALAKKPNRLVAGLTGKAWLEFLDKNGGDGHFCNGPGKILATVPYSTRPEEIDSDALTRLAIGWIRRNG